MASINELPTEVLEKMTQATGQDLTRVEPDSQEAVQPATGEAPRPGGEETLHQIVARMERENGPIGRFNQLLKQREAFNGHVKRLQDQQVTDMLKEKAKTNRDTLAKMFLGPKV